MRSTLLAYVFASFAGLVSVNPVAHAQGTGTSGEIRGMVTDAAGGTVPKATVKVKRSGERISRSVVTESDGLMRWRGYRRPLTP